MTKDKALKLALEALEYLLNQSHENFNVDMAELLAHRAITAIKEALMSVPDGAQPAVTESHKQEPVAWMYQNKSTHEVRFQKHMRSFVDHGAWYEVPLYSEPLANQEKTSGSPKPAKPEALRLADAMEYDLDWCDEAAAELRRMHDLLGKANALCRIRAEEIERLKAQPEQEPVAVKTLSKIGRATGYWRADLVPPHIRPDSHDITPLYASPPQRNPLTRKEVLAIIDKHPAEKKTGLPMFYRDQVLDIARAIEAAHGIKGEA